MTTAEPATEPPVVVRDVFPAEVRVVDGELWRSARVVVTADRVHVYAGNRVEVLTEPYDREASTVPRYNAPTSERTTLRLLDGRTVTVHRQRGCGCGSPLKAWRPWAPWRIGA